MPDIDFYKLAREPKTSDTEFLWGNAFQVTKNWIQTGL